MNNVNLIGRLTRDPELRYTSAGMARATFTLAVDKQLSKEKKQELEAKNQPTADFIFITVWGKMAETVSNFLVKGRLVAVQGRIQTGSYDKDGQRIFTTDIIASNVQFLEWDKKDSTPKEEPASDDFGGYIPDYDDIPF